MSNKIDKIIQIIRKLNEDGVATGGYPTNSLTPGKIAGTEFSGDHPPVRKSKSEKKYIKNGKGSRKMWLNFFKK
jgi:hypothetical protein